MMVDANDMWSHHQSAAVAIIPKVSSILSLFGSGWIIYEFLTHRGHEQPNPHHQHQPKEPIQQTLQQPKSTTTRTVIDVKNETGNENEKQQQQQRRVQRVQRSLNKSFRKSWKSIRYWSFSSRSSPQPSTQVFKPKLHHSYNRLLLAMCLYDVIGSIGKFMSTWPIETLPPLDDVSSMGLRHQSTSCSVQGLAVQLSLAVPVYNAFLALYNILVVHYHIREEVLKKRFEPLMHILAFSIAFGTSVPLTGLGYMGDSDLWCWIAPPSLVVDRNGNQSAKVDNDTKTWILRLALYFGPVWICILVAGSCLINLYWDVRRAEKRTGKYRVPEIKMSQKSGSQNCHDNNITTSNNNNIESSKCGNDYTSNNNFKIENAAIAERCICHSDDADHNKPKEDTQHERTHGKCPLVTQRSSDILLDKDSAYSTTKETDVDHEACFTEQDEKSPKKSLVNDEHTNNVNDSNTFDSHKVDLDSNTYQEDVQKVYQQVANNNLPNATNVSDPCCDVNIPNSSELYDLNISSSNLELATTNNVRVYWQQLFHQNSPLVNKNSSSSINVIDIDKYQDVEQVGGHITSSSDKLITSEIQFKQELRTQHEFFGVTDFSNNDDASAAELGLHNHENDDISTKSSREERLMLAEKFFEENKEFYSFKQQHKQQRHQDHPKQSLQKKEILPPGRSDLGMLPRFWRCNTSPKLSLFSYCESIRQRRREYVRCHPRTVQVTHQSFWYMLAFVLPHLCSTTHRIYQYYHVNNNNSQQILFTLSLMYAIFDPLQGLLNFLVYQRTRYVIVRKKNPQIGRIGAIWRVLQFSSSWYHNTIRLQKQQENGPANLSHHATRQQSQNDHHNIPSRSPSTTSNRHNSSEFQLVLVDCSLQPSEDFSAALPSNAATEAENNESDSKFFYKTEDNSTFFNDANNIHETMPQISNNMSDECKTGLDEVETERKSICWTTLPKPRRKGVTTEDLLVNSFLESSWGFLIGTYEDPTEYEDDPVMEVIVED